MNTFQRMPVGRSRAIERRFVDLKAERWHGREIDTPVLSIAAAKTGPILNG